MPVGKVRQYPYFVRPFHTSTPLRSVELRMKKESRDLVASTGYLCFFFMINLPLKSFDQYRLVKSLRKQPPLNALPPRISSKHLLVSAQSHDVNE